MKAGWTYKNLADLCTFFGDGDWIESKDQSSNGIRLIQTGNVGEGVFKDRGDKARYVNEETFDRLRCTEIFEGDCLISRLPDPVGRSSILPDTGERMITAVDCTIVRFNHELCLPEFFNYYSQSIEYINNISERCTGTTRNRISRSQLGNTPIPTPDVGEQRRIVTLLDEAFADITTAKANAEKNLQNARELFSNQLSLALIPSGPDWVETTVGETCTLKSGTTVPISIERPDGEIPYVKVAEMSMPENAEGICTSIRFLDRSDVKNGWLIPAGAVIFPKRGGAILTNKKRLVLREMCADLNIMSVIPSEVLTPELLYFYFLNVDMRVLGTGSSIPQINNYDIAPLKISFPKSKEKQVELTEMLRSIEAECHSLESIYRQKLTALDDLKKSLLHQAFSGQL